MNDPLVDRDCVLLDGHCVCKYPFLDCKYLDKIEEKNPPPTGAIEGVDHILDKEPVK